MFGNQLANHHRQASLVSAASSLEQSFTETELSTTLRRHKTSNIVFQIGSTELSSSNASSRSCFRWLQIFYEKSRLHYLLPIFILVIYSFLGGFIFYSIEAPEERLVLEQKKDYIAREESALVREIQRIQHRTRSIFESFPETEKRIRELRKYRPFAMNRLNKAVYWYVLQVYYLNDQESYKASLLHPNNPERIWKVHFTSNFGRIVALKNYTQQATPPISLPHISCFFELSNRCWEIGVELLEPEEVNARLKKSLEEFNRFTGLQQILMSTWTFWNSMLFSVSTYSTIGYGNITPKSRLGRLGAMIYAVIGIPLMLMILSKLGHFCLLALEYFWNHVIWVMESVRCVKNAEKLKGKMQHESGGMPVMLAVGVAFGWMFLCAAIFLRFEQDWDYFKSFYFFFISLTTIGYGDVTPSRSEDMFMMFGLIIIGLSLVSMCVNVIQLKLEEIFEELLISLIEEYGGQGAGISGPDLKPKLTAFDLWKMWKKKRRQKQSQRPAITTQQQRQQQRRLVNDFNFWKLFPFAKRRREVLLHEFRNRLQQTTKEKATQTEQYVYSLHTLNYVQELDEVSLTVTSTSGNDAPAEHSPNNQTSSTSASSSSSSAKRVRVVLSEESSSSPSFLSSSSSSSYTRRYLPNRKSERRHTTFSNTTNTTYGGASVQSAPIDATNTRAISPHSSALIKQYAGTRRWTFFECGKTPRGAPRGLVIPAMYLRRQANTHETTELKRLIAEMDSRLSTCRSLVSPCSRAVSRASSGRPNEEGEPPPK